MGEETTFHAEPSQCSVTGELLDWPTAHALFDATAEMLCKWSTRGDGMIDHEEPFQCSIVDGPSMIHTSFGATAEIDVADKLETTVQLTPSQWSTPSPSAAQTSVADVALIDKIG
jgi:hypothetical protein